MDVSAPQNIENNLKLVGLQEATKLNKYNIENRFITTLYERWRPETHTFLFPSGECTITLKGVHMLLGLKINGEPVTCLTKVSWEIVEPSLGSMPLKAKRDKNNIKLVSLEHYINDISMEDPPTIQLCLEPYLIFDRHSFNA